MMEQLHAADSHYLNHHEAVGNQPENDKSNSRQSYEVPRAQNWPALPSHVRGTTISPIFSILLDVVLILVSLLFFCLATTALCIRNRPTGDHVGATVEEAMKIVSYLVFRALSLSLIR
jgi:hypothetical protein